MDDDNMKVMKRNAYFDAYERYISKFQCKMFVLKEFFNVYEYDTCPYYGVLVNRLFQIKKEDLKRLEEHAKTDGNRTIIIISGKR